MASGPTVLLTRRAVQAVAQTVARETHKKVLAPYLVPPAVFYLNQVFRWKRLVELAPQQAEQPVAKPAPAPVKQKRSRLRRFKSLCAAAAHALPLSGLRAVAVHAAQQLTSLSAVASFSTVAVGGLALGVAAKGVRRWHAARRSAKRAMVAINAGPAAEVAIMTYNIRAVMDRWPERAPMLRRCLKQADADVYCFQEVLTGEFGQEQRLLGPDYTVYECRAALQNLGSSSLAGAAYASAMRALLGVSWTRSLLVSLPESVEGWREKNQVSSNWARLLRDLAMAPFYGNSIATRLPVVPRLTALQVKDSNTSSSSSSSNSSSRNNNSKNSNSSSKLSSIGACNHSSYTHFWTNAKRSSSSSSSISSNAADVLVLGDYRAAQRVCLQLQLSPAPSSASQQQPQQQLPSAVSEAAAASAADDCSSSRNNTRAAVAAGRLGAAGGSSSSGSGSEAVYVWLVNTHLDHATPDIRKRQTEAICSWVDPLKCCCAGIIVTGDLNAPPDEELHSIMAAHGFLSTHRVAHGTEPGHTWPSGIQAPLMDEGEPHCADYIYAWQAPGYQLHVTAAQLWGHTPAEDDDTLYPSDHIGLKVKLRVVANGSSSSNSHKQQ